MGDWQRLRLSDLAFQALERELIDSPTKGPVIEGTGGLRKLRFAPPGSGKGRSGSYRICYAFFPAYGTIALFVVFGKNERGDLSPGEARATARALQAFEISRTEGLQSKRLTIHTYRTPALPRVYQPADVKRVRELLRASQAVLAEFLGVNVNTVRSWEQGKRQPQPIACRFLSEIEAGPEYWRKRIFRQPECGVPGVGPPVQ